MRSKNVLMIVVAGAPLAAIGAAVYAQDKFDKYSLVSPSGIAFADFRGYEDWSVVSSARTDEVLKVIVANPEMIKAYKAGVPGNGKPSGRLQDRETPVELQEEHRGALRRGCAERPDAGLLHGEGQQAVPAHRRLGIRGPRP